MMTDAGFIGESQRQLLPKQQGAVTLAGRTAQVLAFAGFVVGGVVGLMLGGTVTPFHYVDAMAVVGVALGPAVLVLAGARLVSPGVGGLMKRLDLLGGFAVFFVMIPGNYLLYLNQQLDHSPAVEDVVPVEETWIRTGRHGSKTYMANVDAGIASPLGRWSFYDAQPVSLPVAEWRGLVPGRSALTLRVHSGRFGFPWYEPDPKATVR